MVGTITAISERIEAASLGRWPGPPHGYPRLNEAKLGRFSLGKARRALACGFVARQPQLQLVPMRHAPAGPVSLHELAVVAAAALGVCVVSAIVHSQAGFVAGVAVLFAGFFVLQTGIHRPVVRTVLNATGFRYDLGAIEYVPWVYGLPVAAASGRTFAAALPLPTPARRPNGAVGPDCAIVVVAEQICAELRQDQQYARDVGLVLGKTPVDTKEQMHQIAWAVADLIAHRQRVQAIAGEGDRDWINAVTEERQALIERVAALELRRQEMTEALEVMAEAAAELSDSAPAAPVVPDLSDLYANSLVHRQAANVIAGGAR
ncbi:hypothetical protein [Mycobacteroides franklinii]|uniref:Uncharacterized protein n=1 Tax=Mycobacteroides franklinii TaxID=948102 RepID=A0A4R5PEP9_9MYCO|nr:hypothetical protein [Mycobacteroides franklinii]ORA60917.1 hypothetical protein BST24_12130 [Mycobacteroides franklinii]TDH23147.1 hypothetical protein EJ571_06720 [Mycobacteroides franklinii]